MSKQATLTIDYSHWTLFLEKMNAICSPAELQGMLCGLLSSGQRFNAEQWLERAFEFMELPDAPLSETLKDALEAFYELTLGALEDPDYSFRLILPGDDIDIADRVEALGLWVQGFLHGLGASGQSAMQSLSRHSEELVQDFSQIANVSIEQSGSEENEVYYTELSEYVRVGILTIFNEYNTLSRVPEGKAQLH